ncbi:MAG: lysS [Gammaproteobacteria bacterium]|jgi:lysyl-tRNA synthetase class 2|nr:lysS [Gammaproteobacteria bacterium]
MADIENSVIDTNELIAQRRAKLTVLRSKGNPYPNDFDRDALAAQIHHAYQDKAESELEAEPVVVKIAGRIMTRRLMGKASFVHLQDMSGKIQLYIRQDAISSELYEQFLQWDLGDIIGVEGSVFKTKTGELSIRVQHLRLLTKALRPLPDKYHGLMDQELCYRQRYLDLLSNESTRQIFIIRSKIIIKIREFLTHQGFIEVETPMMQVMPGGAAARPFVTHHNVLDMPLFLRIAPELYLKRLVVGGFERVFEINRNFRNEGLSTQHNPEFTMLEFYQAYADFHDLMNLSEDLFRYLAQAVLGTMIIQYQSEHFDLSKPFVRLNMLDSILHYNPTLEKSDLATLESAKITAEKLGISIKDTEGLGKIQLEIFEKTVEHRLMQPTFITDYPAEVSPLARRNDKNPFVTDRFELFIAGREIANGFSELNDPEDQAERFRKQVVNKQAGDEEAMPYDEDYITALEYGMPPTAGEGIGIDRLVMLFTNSPSIRDVILFPHMRPVKE